MKPPASVIITMFTPEQFKTAFSRDNIVEAPYYMLLRLIAPRIGPGGNHFLIVPLQDPVQRIQFVVWDVVQVPTDPRSTAASGGRYFIHDDDEFWVTGTELPKLIQSIGEEQFYDVLEFPSPSEFHEQMKRKLYR